MKYLLLILILSLANSQEVIELPEPQKSGGMPLNEALSLRQTKRDFHDGLAGELTPQELSQLLWACYGINRPEIGYKTVPSSEAYFPYDVYVFMKSGVYLYDPTNHALNLSRSDDMRAQTGYDPFVKNAYVDICFYGKYDRVHIPQREVQQMDIELDAGYATQNMYLVAAAEGFQAVSRGNFNYTGVVEMLGFTLNDTYVPLCFSAGR